MISRKRLARLPHSFISRSMPHILSTASSQRSYLRSMRHRIAAIAEPLRRKPVVLHEKRVLVPRAEIPAGLPDRVPGAKRELAARQLTPCYGTHRASRALWDFQFGQLFRAARYLVRKQVSFFCSVLACSEVTHFSSPLI